MRQKMFRSGCKPELGLQDKSYYVYNQRIEKDYFQKRKKGKLFIVQ